MNPSNFFGSQQGAFQAPNNGNRSAGIFQSFTQQSPINSQQNVGFGQTSTFGQPSAFSQPTVFGPTSGQTSVFGQPSVFGQNPSFGQSGGLNQTTAQTPAFGQTTLGQTTTGFGTPSPFAQPSGQSQGLMFTQPSSFGQTPAFGQTGTFGQQTTGFGVQGATSSSGASGTQPINFGSKSALSQPSAFPQPTAASTSSLNVQNVPQKTGFGVSEFGFKPSTEAVFKPIFRSSPEPANTQPSSEPFGTSMAAPTSMDSSGPPSTGFPSAQTGTLGFSFARPTTAASITGPAASGAPQRDTPSSSSSSVSNVKFLFSQPAAPSSSSAGVVQPTAVPSSPSSFSFTSKSLQPQAESEKFTFGMSRQSAFGEPKAKSEAPTSAEPSQGTDEATGESSAFVSFGKGTKRKEEPEDPAASQGKTAKVEVEDPGAAAASRQPSKRPILRSRGMAGGLFTNAMRSVLRTSVAAVKREAKDDEQAPDWGQSQRSDAIAPAGRVSAPPPRSQAPTREVLEKAEEMASLEIVEPEDTTPKAGKRQQRQESSDSVGGLSPTDLIILQCKGVPPNLNRKEIIEKHFNRFAKVRRVYCRPQKNLAIVHFQDHASAAKAKKRGKMLQGNELTIFYQRKKQSPAEKGGRSTEGESAAGETEVRQKGFQASPLRRPLPRSPAVSSTVTISKGSPIKKPAIAKALQFDSESQQESSGEGPSSERSASSLPSSLLHLIGQVAETAEEKYRLLEQRDKILRQGRPKRTDLDMSKVFVGTCPDMCPEKERYMRETRNQLSSYEVLPETEKVDHCAAIKEYSRSSADQEEPLPHELRPLPVLKMTMDYLVTQVMDQGEDNYADWYDFVWNRTRGIRKDITQQHLCDPDTVSLIEKCTRFHIHCAHHLCQEPMMSFDAKINNENMTKCLQSLKEMYQDLATRGVHCPNEAEFRQYNVLLKMNDGDILREVQQFREEVRNSPEVKFAVQAFAAHNSNNFVRFFKLVKSASYLSSCILHRYFNQVRGTALRALNIAFTIGSRSSTAFPLDNLVRMLMFRNTDEAASFIQHYGLVINESLVELSRTAYQEPELSLPQRKSVAIEKKRAVLIGQVVNGGPLPNPPQHMPVCSFDAQNKYRGEKQLVAEAAPAPGAPGVVAFKQEQKSALESKLRVLAEPRLLAERQPTVVVTEPGEADETEQRAAEAAAGLPAPPQETLQSLYQPSEQAQPDRPPSPPPKPEVVYSDQDIMAEVESVVEEVLVAEVSGVAKDGAEYVSTALSVSDGHLEAVVSEVVQEMLRDISVAEMSAEKQRIAEERRRLEEARRRQEREAFLDLFSRELCQEISEEVVSECIKEAAASEIQLAQEERAACVARSSQAVCEDLVEEALQMELSELAQEILDADLQRIHKYINKWRDVVAVRRQLKRQMRAFPAAPCCVDPRFKMNALAPSAPQNPSLDGLARGLVNLGNAGNMAVSCTRLLKFRKEALHQMRVHYFYNQLLTECVWSPLDLPTLVAESLPNPPERIFWKAMVLLPSCQDSDSNVTNSILTDWLEAKLSGGEERVESSDLPAGAVQTLTISNGLRELEHRTHKVHVCIKVSRGPLAEDTQAQLEESKELLGTNALLMLLPPTLDREGESDNEEDEDVSLLSALLQLKQVQQCSSGQHAPMPLAVVVPGHLVEALSDQKLEEDLMLKTLVADGLISDYIFVRIPETTNDMQGTEQVKQAVKWLAAHSLSASPLTSQTLVAFVEGGLCREFSSRLYRDKQERSRAGLPSQDPAPIIQLYNSVLLFLAGLVASEELCGLSWPPSEFSLPETRDLLPHLDWNSPPHLAWLRRVILSLQLPEWDLPPVTASWPCLCASISQYVSQIPFSSHSQPLLMSHMENLLVRVRARTPAAQEAEDDEDEYLKAGPSFQHVPWDEIVALCIEHRMRDCWPPKCPVPPDAITDDGQVLVYFQKEALSHFLPPDSWAQAVRSTHQEKRRQELERSKPSSGLGLTPSVKALKQKLFQSLLEVEPQETPRELDITHTPAPHQLLPQHLLSGIEQEKALSQRCEDQLRRWLDGDSLDTPTMPLLVPSTLLMLPELMTHTRKPSASAVAMDTSLTQADDDDMEMGCGDWLRPAPVSIAQRIQDLDRTIAASREEELAFGLTLSSLLNIVED